MGDVGFVETQGVFGHDHVAIIGRGDGGHARAIAPQVLLDFLFGAIGLLLVGGTFDPHATI